MVSILSYKGYNITEENSSITVDGIKDFNPVHVFECGQCFRWIRQDDGSYTGVVGDKAVNIKFCGDSITISGSTIQDFKNIWFEYFDLERDYSEIKAKLRRDSIMGKAIDFGYGIRLLKQDMWEMLISFIISANNRIPMIMKIVEEISRVYGEEIRLTTEIRLDSNNACHTFPGAGLLSCSSVEQLKICGGGFRCRYIAQASAMVQNNIVDMKKIGDMLTDGARNELMRFPGVGPKVADCVLLYSGTKYDVFPTDVWVKRVMEELYFKREASFKEISTFAKDYFGELAGFAQQYLFYYARENKIGVG